MDSNHERVSMTEDQIVDGSEPKTLVYFWGITNEYNAQWKLLGLLLDLKKSDLDTIEHDNPRNATACRMEMLHVWLKTNPANPKVMLDNALKEIQKTAHSKEIHKAESWRMDDTVETQINSLRVDYAAIATKACKCLETHDRSAAHTAVWLNEVLRGTHSEPLIVERSVSEYSDLFLQLQKKWSFTNPTLLEQLLKILKNDSLNKELAEYTKRFKKVCSEFPINTAVHFEPYDPSQSCLVLILNFESFDGIKIFLEDVFDIYARYLRVHMITPGNIKKMTVQFPAGMEPLIQPLAEEAARRTNAHTNTHTTEPQTEQSVPTMPDVTATQNQTIEVLKRPAEVNIDQEETKIPKKHNLPSVRNMHENSVCAKHYVQ